MATSIIHGNTDIGWLDVPQKVDMASLLYRIKNGIVYIDGYDNGQYAWTPNKWETIGVLPEEARPSRLIHASGSTRSGGTYEIQVDINSGAIILNPSTNVGWKSFSLSYPAK